jgi:hypothetical protein
MLYCLTQPMLVRTSAHTRLNVFEFHNVIIAQYAQNDVFHPNCCLHLPYMTVWTEAYTSWSFSIVLLW